MIRTQKIFGLLALVFSFIYQGCGPTGPTGPIEIWDAEGEPPEETKTAFTIRNESSYILDNIKWQNNTVSDALSPGAVGTIDISADASGYIFFTKSGASPMNLRTQEVVTVSKAENIMFTITNNTVVIEVANPDNTGALAAIVPLVTTLTIKNISFSDLLSVEWQGIGFAENTLENSIALGKSVTKTVNPGYGYIYFKRKSNPAAARTKDTITIEKNETKEFVFTDNTLIVEANNPDNTGTLKDMQTTVVFFDDAEGEVQGYTERKDSAYYASKSDLPNYGSSGWTSYYFEPKNGKKSIAVGGSTDAKLRLTVTLDRPAKLSFWYANKGNGNGTFLIDDETKNTWIGNINWSKGEYTLSSGTHEIVWAKDGYSLYDYHYSNFYLSLDDILVVYTE
jgi:hypothetical protein